MGHGYSDLFGVGGRAFLAELELSGPRTFVLGESLEVIDHLTVKIEEADAYVDTHSERPAPMVRRLETAPGFGPRLSIHASLEIVDIARFPDDGDYVSYCGLAPGTHISDETVHPQGLLPWSCPGFVDTPTLG